MIGGHGGDIHSLARRLGTAPEAILDMSSNVNPLGPPAGLVAHLRDRLDDILALPQADAADAVFAFASRHGLSPDRVVAGNGTTQLIHDLPLALRSRRALIVAPTYADYADACALHGTAATLFPLIPEENFLPDVDRLAHAMAGHDLAFLCNPNNPTGRLLDGDALERLAARIPNTRLIVDESYLAFAPDGERHSLLGRDIPNVAVLHSMSKLFRIPGLRIGFLAGPASIVRDMARYRQPWCLNAMAQRAVVWLMSRPAETDAFTADTRRYLAEQRASMTAALSAIDGLTVYESVTSFLLLRLPDGLSAAGAWEGMAGRGILIRNCANFAGLSDRFIRISLKDPEANRRVVETLAEWLRARRGGR